MVLFNDESRDNLIVGANLIADAVATTYGPNGKNVFIQGASGLIVTKDGATVAQHVSHMKPEVEMGIELVRKTAMKTADDVGDGTTTATVLTRELINLLKDSKEHPITIGRKLKEDVENVINVLEVQRKLIETKEDLIKVATISTNNDPELGKLIGETYHKVGKNGVVYVEEGSDTSDVVDITNGMSVESGMASPYFINNENNECELDDVLVYVSNFKLNKPKDIVEIADRAIREKKELLIIAPKSDSSVIMSLLNNSQSGVLKSCLINPPSNGRYRDMILNDIKNNIGEYCEKVIISLENTTFKGGSKLPECKQEIEKIEKILANSELSQFEIELHSKRLANYTGGIATIKVGGNAAAEVRERKDRVDDAVCAVRAAYHEGVLPGGGISLAKSANILEGELHYMNRVLRKPLEILRNSSNIEGNDTWDVDFWIDKNLKDGLIVNYYDTGIVDPFLVTKISLENAVSAASLILTSGCSIC